MRRKFNYRGYKVSHEKKNCNEIFPIRGEAVSNNVIFIAMEEVVSNLIVKFRPKPQM